MRQGAQLVRTPQTAPLSLETINLRRLVIEGPSLVEPTSEPPMLEPDVDFDMLQAEEGWTFFVTLSLSYTAIDGDARDRIKIEIEGLFTLPEDTPEERVWQLVPGNCLAMLFGAARGIIAQSTGTTHRGAYCLPSMNFVPLIEKKAREQAELVEEPAATKRSAGKKKAPARKKAATRKRKTTPRKKVN